LNDFKERLEDLLRALREAREVGHIDGLYTVFAALILLLIERERIPEGARERIARGWKDD
jgi:hypothetical protein